MGRIIVNNNSSLSDKGRVMTIKRGSERPGAKLSDELVRQIRINRNGWPRWK